MLITSLLDDGATTLKAIELTIELQLKPGSSKYFERKIKDYIYILILEESNMEYGFWLWTNLEPRWGSAQGQRTIDIYIMHAIFCLLLQSHCTLDIWGLISFFSRGINWLIIYSCIHFCIVITAVTSRHIHFSWFPRRHYCFSKE